MNATITLCRSSHPDFEFFVSTIVKGRQLSVRTHTIEDAREWAGTLVEQGKSHGITFEIVEAI